SARPSVGSSSAGERAMSMAWRIGWRRPDRMRGYQVVLKPCQAEGESHDWMAACDELQVSGFAGTPDEALRCLADSIASLIEVHGGLPGRQRGHRRGARAGGDGATSASAVDANQ